MYTNEQMPWWAKAKEREEGDRQDSKVNEKSGVCTLVTSTKIFDVGLAYNCYARVV